MVRDYLGELAASDTHGSTVRHNHIVGWDEIPE